MFTVELLDRSYQHIGMTRLRFEPKRWGGNVRGGHEFADIEVEGPAEDIESLKDALRYGVIIRNEKGQMVWWGYVHEVKLNKESTTAVLTLDKLANKVRVKHSYESGEGPHAETTAWVEDAWSQLTYGVKERQEEASDTKPAQALEKANRSLEKYKKPPGAPAQTSLQDKATATLTCRGYFDLADWKHFAQPLGHIIHNPSSDASALLGWGFQDLIGFGRGDKTIHQLDCKVNGVRRGDRLKITGTYVAFLGAGYNDGIYTVADGGSQDRVQTYTSNEITFDPGDDIFDLPEAGLGIFSVGEMILVSGTGGPNDKYHMLDGVKMTQLTTWTGWNGTIFFYDSPVPITIKQGCHITVEEDFLKAIPGAGGSNPVVQVTSQVLAQRFTPTEVGTWLVGEIAVYVRRFGSPADNLKMELYSDSAGAIGTLIEAVTFTGIDVQKSEMRVSFTFAGTNSVTNGTYYWLILSRTGTMDWENYYEVSLTESDLVDSLIEYDSAIWSSRVPAAAMLHEVWGVRETTLQIADMVTGTLLAGTDIQQASGIKKPMYRDGNQTAMDEILDLLAFGISDGRYLFADVSPERILRLRASPTADMSTALIWRQGKLIGQSLSNLDRGALPFGQWMILADFSPSTNQAAQLSPVLLDSVEYDADNNQYSWSAYGAEDRFA